MNQQLFVVRRNSGLSGGAETVAARLAQNFSDQFEVHRLWAGNDFKGLKIPKVKGPPWWRAWKYTQCINQLPIYNKNSVVYSLEYGPNCDIYRAGDGIHRINMLRRYGANKTWIFNPWHWLAPRLEKNSFETARYIIANSELVRTDIVKAYPHLQDKVIKIYNGFDDNEFYLSEYKKRVFREKLGLPLVADKILLLSGSGFKRKGLHHAIKVMGWLHEHGCKAYLVVVGKGDSDYVKGDISQAGLEEYILFKGLVNNVAEYYQAADLMILLTLYDQFSNACLEALACGCPVITTRNNGVVEVMKPCSGLVIKNPSENNAISLCGDYILQKIFNSSEIAASVTHLSADNEKKAHLKIINQVFADKNSG
jgi:UDP-glucose:(heptosyl)LPS alpha-1,3-glucosyltransferase